MEAAAPTDRFRDLLAELEREHHRQLKCVIGVAGEPQNDYSSEKTLPEYYSIDNTPAVAQCRSSSERPGFPRRFTHDAASRSRMSSGLAFGGGDAEGGRFRSRAVLQLRDAWCQNVDDDRRLTAESRASIGVHRLYSSEKPEPEPRICFIHPNATYRVVWDVLGLALVFYDMINIPLQVFDPPEPGFVTVMNWVTLLFWTSDLLQSTSIGYYSHGTLVMEQPAIIVHYMRTWLFVDLLAVGPDWVFNIFASDYPASSRLLRTLHLVRMFRLLRIVKLQRVINRLYDHIATEWVFIIAEMIWLIVFILLLNHMIACGWFLLGKWSTDWDMNSWTTATEDFFAKSMAYQYTTAFHWTLTQCTPASMEISPRNSLERAYTILVVLFAMVAFSSIVGTVTSSMTIIRQMTNNTQKQFWKLRRYLRQNSINSDLMIRMVRFLEHTNLKKQNIIQAGDVKMIGFLSDQLAQELSYEMSAPCVREHPFFKCVIEAMKSMAYTICHMLKPQMLAAGDVVFSAGEEALRTYIIKSGQIEYHMQWSPPLDPPPQRGEWLAEAVLWTPWRHQGKSSVHSPSELLVLEVESFMEVITIHPKTWICAKRYGTDFVRFLNTLRPAERNDVLRDVDFAEGIRRGRSTNALGGEGADEQEEEEDVSV